MKCPICEAELNLKHNDIDMVEESHEVLITLTFNCKCGSNGTFYFDLDSQATRMWDSNGVEVTMSDLAQRTEDIA